MNLLVQKLKLNMGEWSVYQLPNGFKASTSLNEIGRSYSGTGQGRSVKLAKEEASKKILTQYYSQNPDKMVLMNKIHENIKLGI